MRITITPVRRFLLIVFTLPYAKRWKQKNCAVYVVAGYDADGRKDVLGLWIVESETVLRNQYKC